MLIRNIKESDLSVVLEIESQNFPENEVLNSSFIASLIKTSSDLCFVVEDEGETLAYVLCQLSPQRYLEDHLFYDVAPKQGRYLIVISLSVHPHYHKQGLGTMLLAILKDVVKYYNYQAISLTCHDRLVSYYQLNGFIDEGLSASRFGGEEWINMVWEPLKG